MDFLLDKYKNFKYKSSFYAGLIAGLVAHMLVIVNRWPNSDSMTNFYFDQNMVTSGRWFLVVACGISSFYDLPWINGLLAILFLSIAAVCVCMFCEVESKTLKVLIPVIMAAFPAVASTMTYLYTADGYMMAFAFAVLAALVTKLNKKWGFVIGGVLLSLSMGCYQAYLAATILLCMFSITMMIAKGDKLKEVWSRGWRFLAMGSIGAILYFVLLKVCLKLEGKVLDTYQGINTMGKLSIADIPVRIKGAYSDFFAFALRGNTLWNNRFSMALMVLLILATCFSFVYMFIKTKAVKKWYNTAILVFIGLCIPVAANVIMLVSAEVENHLLMRFHWSLFIVFALVILEKGLRGYKNKPCKYIYAVAVITAMVIAYQYIVVDNIAYFNLHERNEKTYAYCVRLLDRIEQTEGYYQGIPIAMVGVISPDEFPSTDITSAVTDHMIGARGDFLLYKPEMYVEYFRNFLGVELNFVDEDTLMNIYYSDEYVNMDSFPKSDSTKVVDGIMYVKVENKQR